MYTTVANIQYKLDKTLTTNQSAWFTNVLDSAIDSFINSQTHTMFGSTTVTDAYVSGNGTSIMVIPTMHDITAVYKQNNDGTETLEDSATWIKYPIAEDDKYALRKLNSDTWDDGFDNYRVHGVLGFKTVPADIALVATELAINSFQSNYNNYQREKVGDWEVYYKDMANALSPESTQILNRYRRLSRSI